jgi:large subunit ribosomal protein L18
MSDRAKRTKIKSKITNRTYKNIDKHFVGVKKSNLYTYAYLVDPSGKVLKGFSTKGIQGKKQDSAEKIGEELGKFIVSKKIDGIYFNRSGYLYQGRVKAVCEGLRKAGVKL